jgi:hypothetical protein
MNAQIGQEPGKEIEMSFFEKVGFAVFAMFAEMFKSFEGAKA